MRCPPDAIPRTVDYYLARTSHGSTLSAVVHAWVLARSRRADAIDYLREGLHSDVDDLQGGSTAEGIHLAAMAGSVDLLQRCYASVETRADTLILSPRWPPETRPPRTRRPLPPTPPAATRVRHLGRGHLRPRRPRSDPPGV
jgi:trehalose/maltose hydrolase-like predicted phosphorylase